MALLISAEQVGALATTEVVLQALRAGFAAEAKGLARLPVRLDAPSANGFLRTMPAVLDDVMGLKVMTLVEGLGTRYLVLLYAVDTGALLALLDADELTRLRTAGTTALAGMRMVTAPPTRLGVIGTGFEAQGHLAMLSELWPLEAASAYSRAEGNRRRFAASMSERLGIDVCAATSPREAVRSAEVVLLATKSRAPVVDGADFLPGGVVLSIGSTRPDLRELDAATLARAATVVVDDREQVLHESADIIAAIEGGHLEERRLLPLAELVADGSAPPPAAGGRDLLVFKSVGTALQDLALARVLYERARTDGIGVELGELPRLKTFTKG